jgi:hypothetical protein
MCEREQATHFFSHSRTDLPAEQADTHTFLELPKTSLTLMMNCMDSVNVLVDQKISFLIKSPKLLSTEGCAPYSSRLAASPN